MIEELTKDLVDYLKIHYSLSVPEARSYASGYLAARYDLGLLTAGESEEILNNVSKELNKL